MIPVKQKGRTFAVSSPFRNLMSFRDDLGLPVLRSPDLEVAPCPTQP